MKKAIVLSVCAVLLVTAVALAIPFGITQAQKGDRITAENYTGPYPELFMIYERSSFSDRYPKTEEASNVNDEDIPTAPAYTEEELEEIRNGFEQSDAYWNNVYNQYYAFAQHCFDIYNKYTGEALSIDKNKYYSDQINAYGPAMVDFYKKYSNSFSAEENEYIIAYIVDSVLSNFNYTHAEPIYVEARDIFLYHFGNGKAEYKYITEFN